MRVRTSVLGEAGDLSAPEGSQAWAIAVRLQVQLKLKDRHDTENRLRKWCDKFREREGWRALTDRRGRAFESWDAFCAHPKPQGLGESATTIAAEIHLRTGRGRPTKEEQESRKGYPINKKGTSGPYLLARLDRDHPDLAAQVRAGALKAKTAARQVGIIRDKTALEQLTHWWRKATVEERQTFLATVTGEVTHGR